MGQKGVKKMKNSTLLYCVLSLSTVSVSPSDIAMTFPVMVSAVEGSAKQTSKIEKIGLANMYLF